MDLICDCPILTVSCDTPAWRAARTLCRHENRRLLVADRSTGDRLVGADLMGIVTRSDLLRCYLRPDASIRADIISGVFPGLPGIDPNQVEVSVQRGLITLTGHTERRSAVAALISATRRVDGVIEAEEHHLRSGRLLPHLPDRLVITARRGSGTRYTPGR